MSCSKIYTYGKNHLLFNFNPDKKKRRRDNEAFDHRNYHNQEAAISVLYLFHDNIINVPH